MGHPRKKVVDRKRCVQVARADSTRVEPPDRGPPEDVGITVRMSNRAFAALLALITVLVPVLVKALGH